MLGHLLFRYLSQVENLDVYATARSLQGLSNCFSPELKAKIRSDTVDADNFDSVIRALASIQPDIVINCIGLVKQMPIANDPLSAITVNAQLPHRLSLVCRTANARLIHISTDCVFDGKKGMYTEKDDSNATDLYGRTKFLGELSYGHCITLRTSIIGHELKGRYGMIEWFLAQERSVKGYTRAIYSGFPTVELAKIISDYVVPNEDLHGVFHVSSQPISKYHLLKLVADTYGKNIQIEPYHDIIIDRSLDSSAFMKKTNYVPPSWPQLVADMYKDYIEQKEDYHVVP